jgi:hypothetical protein
MKVTNWFGLFPVEQIKKIYKSRRKVEKISNSDEHSNKLDDNYINKYDTYTRGNLNETTRKNRNNNQ